MTKGTLRESLIVYNFTHGYKPSVMDHQLSIWQEQMNPIVRMHNRLVTAHFGNLELNSMRIFLIMLAKMKDATDLTPIKISLYDIDPNCFGGKNFELISKAIEELDVKMKSVRLNYMENGKKVTEKISVIDKVKYVQGTDYLEANFGIAIRGYLVELKGNFTQAELKELLRLRSTYTIRMYMLIKSLYRVGQVYETTFMQLKEMLVGNNEAYPEYKIFKRNILKTSQASLEKTSSAFLLEEHKTGRTITKIIIKPKTYPLSLELKQVISDATQALLEAEKVNTVRISEMLASNDITEEYILYVVDLKKKDKKIKKPGGAIYDAIVNKQLWDDYQQSLKKPAPVPARPRVSKTDNEFTTITLAEAEKMYEEEKAMGKMKYPFPGFAKAMKTGRKILIQGFEYK